MPKKPPRYQRTSDEITVMDTTWLDLGQLRELVRLADERDWPDSALVCHGTGSGHPSRHDVNVAHRLVVEGNDPPPRMLTWGPTTPPTQEDS